MDSALAWVGQIADWAGAFIPRWIVLRSTHGAVKFVRGVPHTVDGPCILWYWPIITEVKTFPTVRTANDLKSQTVVTTDDKTIVVSGMIIYEVRDVGAILATTFDAEETIMDICLCVVHDTVCALSWDDIKAQQRDGRLDRALRREAAHQLERYGVKVLRLSLTDLAPCRVLKVVQATTKDD